MKGIRELLSDRAHQRRLKYSVPDLETEAGPVVWYFPPFSGEDHVRWAQGMAEGEISAYAEFIAARCQYEDGTRVFSDNDVEFIQETLEADLIADIGQKVLDNIATMSQARGNSTTSTD